eukprot:3977927-Amphidinium_carterae.1
MTDDMLLVASCLQQAQDMIQDATVFVFTFVQGCIAAVNRLPFLLAGVLETLGRIAYCIPQCLHVPSCTVVTRSAAHASRALRFLLYIARAAVAPYRKIPSSLQKRKPHIVSGEVVDSEVRGVPTPARAVKCIPGLRKLPRRLRIALKLTTI